MKNVIIKKLIGIPLLLLSLLITVLIGFGFLSISPHNNSTKIVTETNIKTFEIALTAFYTKHKKYPTTNEGLKKIAIYLRNGKIPLDPWNNEYYYEKQNNSYIIISKGPDGILFTTDDIWNENAVIKENLYPAKDSNMIWKILLLLSPLGNIVIMALALCFISNSKITIKTIIEMSPFTAVIIILIVTIIFGIFP